MTDTPNDIFEFPHGDAPLDPKAVGNPIQPSDRQPIPQPVRQPARPSGADLDAVLNLGPMLACDVDSPWPAGIDAGDGRARDLQDPPTDPYAQANAHLRRQARRAAFRRALGPRVVLLGWSAWLLASWALVMGFSATPAAATWMMMSAAIGLVVGYPLFRLSQNAPGMDEPGRRAAHAIAESGGFPMDDEVSDRPPPHPRLSLLLLVDTVSMWAVMQAVVWPLTLVGTWGLARAAGLNATMLGWALIIAALVSLGAGAKWIGARSLAMMMAVLLLVAEPVFTTLTRHTPQTPITPLMQIQAWTQPAELIVSGPMAWSSAMTCVTGLLAWFWSFRVERVRAHGPESTRNRAPR